MGFTCLFQIQNWICVAWNTNNKVIKMSYIVLYIHFAKTIQISIEKKNLPHIKPCITWFYNTMEIFYIILAYHNFQLTWFVCHKNHFRQGLAVTYRYYTVLQYAPLQWLATKTDVIWVTMTIIQINKIHLENVTYTYLFDLWIFSKSETYIV